MTNKIRTLKYGYKSIEIQYHKLNTMKFVLKAKISSIKKYTQTTT